MAGNPCNNIISISVPHDSFIASVYQQLFSVPSLLSFSGQSCVYTLPHHVHMGVCRTNLRMRSWWICQRLSRKYVQKKIRPRRRELGSHHFEWQKNHTSRTSSLVHGERITRWLRVVTLDAPIVSTKTVDYLSTDFLLILIGAVGGSLL